MPKKEYIVYDKEGKLYTLKNSIDMTEAMNTGEFFLENPKKSKKKENKKEEQSNKKEENRNIDFTDKKQEESQQQ